MARISYGYTVPAVALAAALAAPLFAQSPPALPTSWVDKDTGHRVYRLSNEPGSSGFYFNVNAFTPDGKLMVYNAPDGIHVLELATKKTRLVVANPPPPAGDSDARARFRNGVHTIVVGRKTNSVFYIQADPATKVTAIYKADLYSGQSTKLTDLPVGISVGSINADETLGLGTYNEGPKGEILSPEAPRSTTGQANRPAGSLVQADDKQEMMRRRLAARIPVVLFTIDLKTAKVTPLLHSTDWIGHLLFSPTDPTLIMYCHEGPWHKVDRVWMIHTDGTHNTLIHKRTMAMEIAGHEFWGLDGKTIWYDWQYPKGEDFYLAGYNLTTGKRTAYHMQRNEWSIHFNLTQDLDLFTGDGGDPGQVALAPDGEWIELFHPELKPTDGLNEPDFWQPGVFHSERLVNMAHHNYRMEPNVRFTPDKKMVIFSSNMFGQSYVIGVDVEKAVNPPASEIHSTPQLAKEFNPIDPTPTPADK